MKIDLNLLKYRMLRQIDVEYIYNNFVLMMIQ